MKEITPDVIVSCNCRQRQGRENKDDYIKRLTHIGLYKRGITDMAGIDAAKGAAAIYLYDNSISKIEGLSRCRFLSQLYLQNNAIEKIEGLTGLINLEKLHLGKNRITLVEGLEGLKSLRDFSIEDQILPPGEKLVFDPRSMTALSGSLEKLNVAGNRLDDLDDIGILRALRHLNLSNNFVRSMKELEIVLTSNRGIEHLRVSGNPICHVSKHRELIISLCMRLTLLDGKDVTAVQRQFLMNWRMAKHGRKDREKPHDIAKTDPAVPHIARFPSKLSSSNPHWVKPLPFKKNLPQPGPSSGASGFSHPAQSTGGTPYATPPHSHSGRLRARPGATAH